MNGGKNNKKRGKQNQPLWVHEQPTDMITLYRKRFKAIERELKEIKKHLTRRTHEETIEIILKGVDWKSKSNWKQV